MITIVVNTDNEYKAMKRYAEMYVCRRMSLRVCMTQYNHDCDRCFKENSNRMNIRVISPIDNPDSEQL